MDVLVESLHPGFRHRYEPVIRLHESFVAVLDDPIWRLLNPRQVSAGRLANFAADAIAAGAPPLLVLPTENQLSEPECYDLLLRLALTPRFGRPLALRCALIRLRSGGLNGDLVAYESCLRAILDIVSTRASEDVVFESLTGIPCHGGRSGKVSPWLLADRQEGKIMNLADYMVATFSRVELSSLAASHGGEFEQYYRERGLDLGGLPRFAWRGSPPPTSFVSPMRLGLRSRRRGT